MLIYILHSDKIYTFRLPKEISGSYILNDCDVDGRVRNLANISAVNGKWVIKSNEDLKINYNGSELEEVELYEYNFYNLRYMVKDNFLLYVMPGNDTNVIIKSIVNKDKIIIGNTSGCDIVFTSQNISANQIELHYEQGMWKYTNLNPNIPVYINKKRINSSYLCNLDTIFVMGLRVTLMGKKVVINAHPGSVITQSALQEEEKRLIVADVVNEENFKDFYDQKEYFTKSPVFRKKRGTYEVAITPPDGKEKNDGGSLLFQIVPSALMSLTSVISTYYTIQNYRSGQMNKESLVTSLIVCVVMLITGILWPIIEYFASKFRRVIQENLRISNYKKYLKRKRKTLDEIITEQRAIMKFNNLSLKECQDIIEKRNSYLFSRNVDYDTFLSVKLGVGKILSNIDFSYTKPDLIVDNDKLLKDIDAVMSDYKYIENAPFSISLKDTSVALINNGNDYNSLLNSLILQFIALHDYNNLKLVILTSEFSELNKIKNLNHCWNEDKSFRYFASNMREAENISSELIKIYNKNVVLGENPELLNKSTYYLIISDCIDKYKSLAIVDKIINNNKKTNFSILMFGSKMTDIPIGCNYFVVYNEKEASFFQSEMEESKTIKFQPDLIDNTINFNKCIDLMSNIPVKMDNDSQGHLPEKLGFLEMFGVGKIEQLNIINRWKNSRIVNSLAAPVGVDSNGNILDLDLHEKYHGPHGLIAGMTGSGKSEFIITYILSLAINYSPNEVQFVLIDYKGGGLAGAFENKKTRVKLPHLVGTITNLDTAEMNRTLVSIKSELQRRQRKFNEAKEYLNTGTIDIYKYQNLVREGTLKESMSHLFIICDEFAELKAQQPDFMDELVSAARIGRSLGVHLILATQKPAGVVDDQIWSNSKFKVCCKVQTAEDSEEMIRKPDAAYLKESGRFYLQVGYDEYFVKGQSGYSGLQYIPSETVKSKLDNSISFVNNIGDVYKNVLKQEKKDEEQQKVNLGEELNNILKYIVQVAAENNYQNHQLWLDNVPTTLYYNDLIKKYKPEIEMFNINPIIGEYDDPEHQSQGVVTLPITKNGNTQIVGANGMGKSTLLSTIIYSTIVSHASKEVNFYIIDLGTEKLKKFSKAPHVGDVISINESDKINYLFYMIDSEIKKRQSYYSQNGGDYFMDVKNGKCIFPNIIVIIYGMDVFRETFDDQYNGIFANVTRSCSKFGINFIVSGSNPSAMGYVVENNFPQKTTLTLVDSSDYVIYFSNSHVPIKTPGRGLIEIEEKCLEYQSSIIFKEEEEIRNLNYVFERLNAIFPDKAQPVPTIPKKLHIDYIKSNIKTLNNVPLGVNYVTAQIGYYDFSSLVSLMASEKIELINKFIPNLIKILSMINNTNIIVLNAMKELDFKVPDNIKYYDSNFSKILPILSQNIGKYNGIESENKYIIIVLGYTNLKSYISKLQEEDEDVISFENLIINTNNDNFKYIIYDTQSHIRKLYSGVLSDYIDNQYGIWVGEEFDCQNCFDYDNSSINNDVISMNDLVVLVKDTVPEFLKFPNN